MFSIINGNAFKHSHKDNENLISFIDLFMEFQNEDVLIPKGPLVCLVDKWS